MVPQPPKFGTHEDCREAICCCCGKKTVKKRISVKEESLVKSYAKEEYDSKIESFPAGLCPSCRRHLFQCAKKVNWEWINRPHPRLLWDKFELQNERFDPSTHSPATCSICKVARYTPVGQKKVSRLEKPKLAPRGEPIVNPKPRKSSTNICPKCKAITGPGLPHSCTSKAGKINIVELIGKEDVSGQEQILSAGLKNVVNEKGGEPGEELRMTGLRGGNQLSVTVGKAKKQQVHLITPEFMAQLQKKLNCSTRKLLILARDFKKQGLKFEEHIREDLEKLSHSLDEFFTVESLEFEVKSGKGKNANTTKELKDLVFLKDPQAFFDHIVEERGLDREKLLVRVGLDGGQGSFKVVVSIFETDYDPEITFTEKEGPGSRLTGSNRMLMMFLCDDLQVYISVAKSPANFIGATRTIKTPLSGVI